MRQNFQITCWLISVTLFSCAEVCVSAPGGQEKTDSEKAVIYSPVGKRDPFKAPASQWFEKGIGEGSPLERYEISQLSLRAIIKEGRRSRAMLEDPEGKTHLVGQGDVIGRERGTVSRIANTAVIITIKTFDYLGKKALFEKVLYLPQHDDVAEGKNSPSAHTVDAVVHSDLPAAPDSPPAREPGGLLQPRAPQLRYPSKTEAAPVDSPSEETMSGDEQPSSDNPLEGDKGE